MPPSSTVLTPGETMILRAVLEVVARSLSGRPEARAAAVDRAMVRLSVSGASGGDALAWTTTWVVNELLVSPPGRRNELVVEVDGEEFDRHSWRALLVHYQPRDRAAIVLHHVAGYDLPTVASICRRRLSETRAVCDFWATFDDLDDTARRPVPIGIVATLLFVALAVGLITHGSGERPSFAASQPTAQDDVDAQRGCSFRPTLAEGSSTLSVQVGPVTRTALISMPKADQGQALPLVVDLGDYGSTPASRQVESGLAALGATDHFIVATPAALGELPQWNVNQAASQPDDVEFVSDLIQRLSEAVCVDPNRVTVVGYGDGAHMAALLGCVRSDRIAAVAMVNGAYRPPHCSPERPVSVLAISDTADALLPTTGGYGPDFDALTETGTKLLFGSQYQPASLDDTIGGWADLAGCAMAPYQPGANGRETASASGCEAGARVTTMRSNGGGHAWPSDGATEVWSFLRDRSLN